MHIAGRMRHHRSGQSGQSLIEVIIAILVLSATFAALAAALLTVDRTSESNEKLQSINVALETYGEILRTQAPYYPCQAGPPPADRYQGWAETGNDGIGGTSDDPITNNIGSSTGQKWFRADSGHPSQRRVITEVVAVDAWGPTSRQFVSGCPLAAGGAFLPDSGAQRITYAVTADGVTRAGTVVKRKPARS